ncbi:hypothetical protein ACQP2X_45225 [Actinoplanes sp. CA-131856]
MNSFAHAPRKADNDVRLADAWRFVSDVESALSHAQRITGPDRTGTAWAVVDSVGRFVDIGLRPGWWEALGPDGVAAGLLEALESARLKAALVPLLLRRNGEPQRRNGEPRERSGKSQEPGGELWGQSGESREQSGEPQQRSSVPRMRSGERQDLPDLPPPEAADFLDAARGRIAEAYRLIDEAGKRMREQQATRVIAGPRGLFRLYVRGERIERAEAGPQRPVAGDTDRLVADARDALAELARGRDNSLASWRL